MVRNTEIMHFVSSEAVVFVPLAFAVVLVLNVVRKRLAAARIRAARFKAAVERAHHFLDETRAARESFVDNRMVRAWRTAYGADFGFLAGETKRLPPDVMAICEIYDDLRNTVDAWNDEFIRETSAKCDALFDRLDANQREACISDETATLVIAGAGSGKTSTIEKKVEYLVKVRGVPTEDILLLSFTNKSADEMTERLSASMPDAHISASTFHKFGRGIVSKHRAGVYDICDPKLCTETVLHAISPETMTGDECRGLLGFFAFYLNAVPNDPNGFKTFGDYICETRGMNLQTLRGMAEGVRTDKTTFQGEQVKSMEELEIANWLFLNGIAYEYERKYDKPIPDDGHGTHRQYKPDFHLPDYDIWIEHFGIDADGEPPRYFSDAERAAYKAGIMWKRKLHATNKTTLVESYSWWHFEGKLTDRLWDSLKALGVKRHGIDPGPIWKLIRESPKADIVREFAKLVAAFIALAKSKRLSPETVDTVLERGKLDGYARRRAEGFLAQVRPLFKKYEEALSAKGDIDFHDMINEATDIITERPGDIRKFRYVIIDEFQDCSESRAKLVQAVIAATGAKIFCVGDDWQSIYRFAGSDISIFTRFKEHFGFTRTIKLENTYRNSQELLEVAGEFVMKNTRQVRKRLKSTRHCERPVVCVPYGTKRGFGDALRMALEEIASEARGQAASVLLLGRHNAELKWIRAENDIKAGDGVDGFVWMPHKELGIRFLTIHKAKGLEADYVILLNFKDDALGFPNTIADDPILALLLSEKEDLAFAEERRVFYVALTRTKNRIYILVPTNGASAFLDELPKEARAAVLDEADTTAPCPKCKKGHLVIRHRTGCDNETFYGCSNFPRCDYSLSMQGVPICEETPRCKCGGFLVVPRHGAMGGGKFFGCTEYTRLQPYRHQTRLPDSDDSEP